MLFWSVKKQGTIFLGGPPLGKAATGEVVDAEALGGADVHTSVSGVPDHFAQDDRHALEIARKLVGNLNRRKAVQLAVREAREPLSPARELYGIVPTDTRRPFVIRDRQRVASGKRVSVSVALSGRVSLKTTTNHRTALKY